VRQDLKLREADEVGKVESSEKTRRESEKESQFFFLFF
jgi:hypothetical protein